MLHAPDFLGYESAIELARDHPDVVTSALELKKTGNELMTVVGGREVHPINVKVGGWYRAPRKRELRDARAALERAREIALEAVRSPPGFDFPDYEQDYELVALDHPGEYPIDRGRVVSNRGLDIAVPDYDEHFAEEHVEWSNALHSQSHRPAAPTCAGRSRGSRSPPTASRRSPATPPRRSASTRPSETRSGASSCDAVELVYAADEALRIIADYEEPDAPAIAVEPRAGVGHGCTEAPRGILYHRYEIDAEGTILDAKIVPPTSQNQRTIEEDLRGVVERSLDIPTTRSQSVRADDPQLRPLHLLRDALPDARHRAPVTRASSASETGCAATTPRASRSPATCAGRCRAGVDDHRARGRADEPDRRLGGRRGALDRRRRLLGVPSRDRAPAGCQRSGAAAGPVPRVDPSREPRRDRGAGPRHRPAAGPDGRLRHRGRKLRRRRPADPGRRGRRALDVAAAVRERSCGVGAGVRER